MSTLSIAGVQHAFGRHRVLNGIDLTLSAGQCGVLLGANGSGKSTLLAILATRLRLQQGRYRLADWDPLRDGESIRRHILFVGHHTHLYGHLTPLENMRFFCDLHGLRLSLSALEEAVATVGLARFAGQPTRWFSAGMKKRLALARMLLSQPMLLLLDEPDSALDVQGVAWLNGTLAGFQRAGGMIVMASHDPERIAVLDHRPLHLQRGRFIGEEVKENPC